MQHLSARPHHVGSPYDKDNAEWILARFKEWGLDAHIETFNVLFPTPRVRVLEMVAPTKFTAKLDEPVIAIDPTSNQKSEQLPTYNAYSIDGDVTAPLVFVNYGLPVLHLPEAARRLAVQPVEYFLRARNHFAHPANGFNGGRFCGSTARSHGRKWPGCNLSRPSWWRRSAWSSRTTGMTSRATAS